jgi:hypothetical protein
VLQSWNDDLDMATHSVVQHASVLQGDLAAGLQYSFGGIRVGVMGRLGCQRWELVEVGKACSGEAGFHFSARDVTKNLSQLRLYLGFERATGADKLMEAGLQREYAFVFRVEPALTSLIK